MGRRLAVQFVAALLLGASAGVVLHHLGVGGSARASKVGGPPAEVAAARLEREGDVGSGPVAAAEGAVLLVESGGCGEARQASATVLRHGGRTLVLTNAHVVVGSGTVTVTLPGGDVVAATVLGAVPGRDAAVLELPEEAAGSVEPLEVGVPVPPGSPVAVAGHPAGRPRVQGGTVVSVERRAGYGSSSDVLIVDVAVSGGSSGGALLDHDGRVVGLVAAKDPGTGAAVAYPIAEVLGRGSGPIPTC